MSLEELEARLFHIFEAEFAVAFTDQEKEILCTNINYYVMYRDELLENYKKLLYYIRPKVVLYAESFTGEKVVLTEALKEIKIPCIEILHGYMTDNTVEYNYLETGINNALPDYIFTYSQVQKDIIRWGIPKDHVRVVGHPWLEKRKRELLQCNFDKNKSKKVVTFISNANLSIIKYLTFVADLLDPDKYELKLKLHPTEIQENYQDLPDSIEIIYGNRADVQDIHYYLAKSDIVVGIASTALYEAAIYPVEIFVLQESEFEIMNLMLESERATLVNSPEQLYEFVISESRQKSSESMNFFATNAIDHINKQINMIIEETKKVC